MYCDSGIYTRICLSYSTTCVVAEGAQTHRLEFHASCQFRQNQRQMNIVCILSTHLLQKFRYLLRLDFVMI